MQIYEIFETSKRSADDQSELGSSFQKVSWVNLADIPSPRRIYQFRYTMCPFVVSRRGHGDHAHGNHRSCHISTNDLSPMRNINPLVTLPLPVKVKRFSTHCMIASSIYILLAGKYFALSTHKTQKGGESFSPPLTLKPKRVSRWSKPKNLQVPQT